MLAAAALVKVMHRIFDGSTPSGPPSSISRITRCANTCVLPAPAFAETNTAEVGSDAAVCCRRTASGTVRMVMVVCSIYRLITGYTCRPQLSIDMVQLAFFVCGNAGGNILRFTSSLRQAICSVNDDWFLHHLAAF